MRCKALLALTMMSMQLVVYVGYSQDTRVIQGQVLSEESSPVPGLAVIQLGTDNAVATDVNGKFELIVKEGREVYVHLFGLDLEIFLKYEIGDTSKTVDLGDWKQLKRNNRKISNEWTAKNNH